MLTAFAAMQELVKKLFGQSGGFERNCNCHILVPAPQVFPWAVSDWGEEEGWVSWMASGSEAHILQLKVFHLQEQTLPMLIGPQTKRTVSVP